MTVRRAVQVRDLDAGLQRASELQAELLWRQASALRATSIYLTRLQVRLGYVAYWPFRHSWAQLWWWIDT